MDTSVFRKLVTAYFDGVAAKSFVQLASVTTKDFVIYEDGKVWTNDSVFRNIQYHEPFSVTFSQTDCRFWSDQRLGYGSYHNRADFVIADSERFSVDFVETAAFRKTEDGWKLSLIHLTVQKDPMVGEPPLYQRYDTVRYILDHYWDRLIAFKKAPAQTGAIVFLGNSITEFGDWKRLLKDDKVLNRGIAGDNTFGMLDRLGDVIRCHPSKLFIEAGINDLGQGVPVGMIAGNISSMIQYVHIKSPGTRIYVWSVLPTNDDCKADYPEIFGKNALAAQVNTLLRARTVVDNFTYIDLSARVADRAGNLDKKYAREDGLHLNENGYAVLVGMITP